jgi:hypothetical protein
MNLVKTATRVVNLTHVASIERSANGDLTIHYAVPRASVVSGVSHPMHTAPPVATDHYVEFVNGSEAEAIWKQIASV